MGNEYQIVTLGDVIEVLDSQRVPVKERDRRKGIYPYYGASGIVDYVDGYLFDGLHLLIAEDGENLRTRNTPIAFLADGKFWVNNHAHIVIANKTATTQYLSYALQIADFSAFLTGSTIPKLTQQNMLRIPISLPSLSTQQAIARVLGALDDKIELLRSLNETLEAMARALFKSWFVDFDPVRRKAEGKPTGLPPKMDSLFPDSFEDSELGEIPKGWKVLPLGEAVEIAGGSTPRTKETSFWDGSFCFATPKDLSTAISPILTRTERRITQEGVDQITSGQLPAGTLLLSSRAPIGYLAIAAVPVSINQGFIAIKKESKLSPYFMYSWCKEYMDTIIGHANGTTFLEISKANFKTIKTIVPPPGLIEKYDEYEESYFEFITRNTKELMNLVLLRDSLLPRLISGDLELSDDMISKILEKPT